MSHQTTAKQIGELRTAGFVSRTRFGRNTFCELSEPLMRICIEVKDNKTRHFRLFVEFLRHWFITRERDAELQPDDRELWIERTRLHIDEGAFDAAAESAAKIEALPGGSLLGRLFSTQVAAATEPLAVALDTLGAILESEDFKSDERLHLEATAGILTVSVRNFGPRYLAQGLVKLRNLLTPLLHEGVVGRILTDFLKESLDGGFAGSLADWEEALESLAASLADLPDCRIPVEMLEVAVRYTKTGDERHLLRLPLEQRQLLEDVLPRAPGERAVRA